MANLEFQLREYEDCYWRFDAYGNVLAGPFCAKCFVDSGAVIKMETGEESRASGHFAYFRDRSCPVCKHWVCY